MAKEKQKSGKKMPLEKGYKALKRWVRKPTTLYIAGEIFVSVVFLILSLYWIPGEVHYRITEHYQFTAEEKGEVHLAVLLPTSGSMQTVTDPEVTWPGTWDMTLNGRLRQVALEADVPAGETVSATIHYTVNLPQGPARWENDPVQEADLASSPGVDPDNPAVLALSETLQVPGDETQTLQNIYRYAGQAMESALLPGEDPARSIARTVASASTLTSLSRAAGLPTRLVRGLKLPESVPFVPISRQDGHPALAWAWNEVNYDSAWGQVDPNGTGFFLQHPLLGWTDGRHLTYDTRDSVLSALIDLRAAGEPESQWMEAQDAPQPYVAWATMTGEHVQLTTKATITKTWDARWVMFAAILCIILIMNQLRPGNDRRWFSSRK